MATYINKKATREIDGIGTVVVEWCETHWKDGFVEKSNPHVEVNGLRRREFQLMAMNLLDATIEMWDNKDDDAEDVTPEMGLCDEEPPEKQYGRSADSLHTYKI